MLGRHVLSRVFLMLVLWLGVACHSVAVLENSEPDQDLAAYLSVETEDLRAFYAARDGRFVWQHSESVAAFAAALNTLQSDGLNVADYQPGAIMARYRQLQTPYTTASDRLRFELSVSRILLTALTHLQRGKVDPYQIDPQWEIPVMAHALDYQVISEAVDAQHFEQAFSLARPYAAPYQRLRAGLAYYRNIQMEGGWPQLPQRSQLLRPGDVDTDVPLLRQRLAMTAGLGLQNAKPAVQLEEQTAILLEYDEAMVEAVRLFQRHHLLEADGIVGQQTRNAFNVSVDERINQIRTNLERARWLLHGEVSAFILVDIAGYRISYFRPNGEIWRSRIVVGQPYRSTPSLRSEITHLTVNPTWTVPPTIYREDSLPKIRDDIGYLYRQNMSVLNLRGQRLDPQQIDWRNPGGIMLRQGPGPMNALGNLVLRFPNNHLVYLHDTPAQALFGLQQRAFSSGCIRVQGITELAQLLFDDTDTAADVNALIATGNTRNINLRRTMPVILHYWTVHPGEDGELVFRPDIYQKDATLQKALDQPLESQGWFEFTHWTPDESESGLPTDVPVPMAGQ
ncbi:L,D-transpeptidase family protein [Marinobacter psychrophilus]|uniref:L,D-transpeptidase family protein n=1 Tax=Marinobacter psychrophilus TaxID=330734 RepID=UPI001B42A409|nr:L,D-transpeptidase family protein [Marinobacter psychrophilus]MBQ0762013.1 L,D-transpeptidase family protein [Marinobacter psychrophilus]MBQ0844054.1 L,D-transpeptidase family protein [Marinobacter psychrophilus]